MAIEFRCDCGERASVPEAEAGRRARCRGCGELVDVPAFVPARRPGRWRAWLAGLGLLAFGVDLGFWAAGRPTTGPASLLAGAIARAVRPAPAPAHEVDPAAGRLERIRQGPPGFGDDDGFLPAP